MRIEDSIRQQQVWAQERQQEQAGALAEQNAKYPYQKILDRYDFMMDTVQVLGKLAWKYINTGIEMELKPDGTKVTTADVALNEKFIELVEQRYPTDLVWGEELSNSEKNNTEEADKHWMWLIDPIDGTSGFWRSYEQNNFSDCTANIMITGFAPGETTPTMSVISNPFYREKGTISTVGPLNGITYYTPKDSNSPRLVKIDSYRLVPMMTQAVERYEENWWEGSTPDLRKMERIMPYARRTNHQLFMGSVALGDVDISAFPGPSNPHDVSPGAAIVHNAGGTVMSLAGEKYEEIDWRKGPINGVVAASNQVLAEDFVRKIN